MDANQTIKRIVQGITRIARKEVGDDNDGVMVDVVVTFDQETDSFSVRATENESSTEFRGDGDSLDAALAIILKSVEEED